MKKKLAHSFYLDDDVVAISKKLLGKYLFTSIGGKVTGGMIIETEAYKGPDDKASHAFGMRRTKRNEVMYQKGGICYIYLCYGIHSLVNIVTNKEDVPHAVLLRAILPTDGIETMLVRRGKKSQDKTLACGPGSLAKALGLSIKHNGLSVVGPYIWIEDRGVVVTKGDIIASPRVGVDYAEEDALLPWRFRLSKSAIDECQYPNVKELTKTS